MEELIAVMQKLIATQDEFKQDILNEVDVSLHGAIITSYTDKEKALADVIETIKEKITQNQIELFTEIKTEVKTEIKNAKYFADKYTAVKIKTVAKSIGVKTTGTGTEIAELILNKISAEEFENIITKLK